MNPFGAFAPIAFTAMMDMMDMKEKNKEKIEQILAEWRETQNYPRKMKKRVRKRLQLEYSIFTWAQEKLHNNFFL